MLLVDVDETGLRRITAIAVPLFQPLASVKGNLAELGQAIQTAAQSALPDHPVWLEVTVKGDDYLSDLQPRIQALTEGLPVEVLRIRRDRSEAAVQLHAEAKVTLDELSPDDVFAKRLEQEELADELSQKLKQLYQTIVVQLSEAQV